MKAASLSPDLVVETLSPGTASKDTVRKCWTYEAAGVPKYRIVDPDEQVGGRLNITVELWWANSGLLAFL